MFFLFQHLSCWLCEEKENWKNILNLWQSPVKTKFLCVSHGPLEVVHQWPGIVSSHIHIVKLDGLQHLVDVVLVVVNPANKICTCLQSSNHLHNFRLLPVIFTFANHPSSPVYHWIHSQSHRSQVHHTLDSPSSELVWCPREWPDQSQSSILVFQPIRVKYSYLQPDRSSCKPSIILISSNILVSVPVNILKITLLGVDNIGGVEVDTEEVRAVEDHGCDWSELISLVNAGF